MSTMVCDHVAAVLSGFCEECAVKAESEVGKITVVSNYLHLLHVFLKCFGIV